MIVTNGQKTRQVFQKDNLLPGVKTESLRKMRAEMSCHKKVSKESLIIAAAIKYRHPLLVRWPGSFYNLCAIGCYGCVTAD